MRTHSHQVKRSADDRSTSVVDRVLDILLLYGEGKESRTIDEVAEELDLPKSTSYRLVRALQKRGFLDRSSDARYRLGAAMIRLSRLAVSSNQDIRTMALPGMQRIAGAIGESVSLMRLINKRVVCIESIEGWHALRVSIQAGRIQPMHAGASSRVLLAHAPEKEWESMVSLPLQRYTPATITDFEKLRKNLHDVRARQHAISDGEIDVGARAIAVPLKNSRDEVVAALSIEAPAIRMNDDASTQYLALLSQEAAYFRTQHG